MAKTGMSKMVKYSTSINRNIAALKEQGKSLYIDIKAPQDLLLMKTVRFRMIGTVSYPCIKNRKYKNIIYNYIFLYKKRNSEGYTRIKTVVSKWKKWKLCIRRQG